jgi:hypothetical protein
MCTVTLIARQNGYALGMNRDEKLSRVSALRPRRVRLDEREAIFPSEPSGGTWIGVNDCGLTLALINWYSVPDRVSANVVSRGEIVKNLLSSESLDIVNDAFASQPLSRVNPFRLIGISREKQIVEWRWNLRQLSAYDHLWISRTWISSGFDEPGAQRTRGNFFAKALRQHDAGTTSWLRQVHSSHDPKPSAHSTCMHREDAATVSYTEIEVAERWVTLRYANGPLCRADHCKQLSNVGFPFHHSLFRRHS